jgi:hypothetical protein
MPFVFHIFEKEKFVLAKAEGSIAIEEITATGAQIFSHPLWQNGFKILADYSEITHLNLSAQELQNLVSQDNRLSPRFNKSLFAIVAPNDFYFGLFRMWELLSMDNIISSKVLKDLGQALDWLDIKTEDYKRMKMQMETIKK